MNKGLKKVISLVSIIVFLFTLFGPMTFAEEIQTEIYYSEKIINEINKTNDYIYTVIDETVEKAEKEQLKGNKTEEEFEDYLDKLMEKLTEKTYDKVTVLIEKAAKEGIELTRTFIEVEICGRIVLVDPCFAH